jgi:hypothetical protein
MAYNGVHLLGDVLTEISKLITKQQVANPWRRALNLPTRSLPSKCHTVSRYTRICNFVSAHNHSTAFPVSIFMKITNGVIQNFNTIGQSGCNIREKVIEQPPSKYSMTFTVPVVKKLTKTEYILVISRLQNSIKSKEKCTTCEQNFHVE